MKTIIKNISNFWTSTDTSTNVTKIMINVKLFPMVTKIQVPIEICKFVDKVVPKWRITSIDGYGGLYTLRENGKFVNHGLTLDQVKQIYQDGYTYDELLSTDVPKNPYHIKSVQVLQEGKWVEFKIGDKVEWDWIECLVTGFVIQGFTVDSYGDLRMITSNKLEGFNMGMLADSIKICKPLFQLPDENGKMIDIFEGDMFYIVNKNTLGLVYTRSVTKNVNIYKDCPYVRFATEKAALNYVEDNKKVFSKKEIKTALEQMEGEDLDNLYEVSSHLKGILGIK